MNTSWQSFPRPSAAFKKQRDCALEHRYKGYQHLGLVLWCQLKKTFLRRRFFYTHEICVSQRRQRVFHIEYMSSMLVVCKVLLFTIPSRQETPKIERRHLRRNAAKRRTCYRYVVQANINVGLKLRALVR